MYFEFDSDPEPKDCSSEDDKRPAERRSLTKCATSMNPTFRNRRYSIHSEIPSRSLCFRGATPTGSNCDLALLAKKKLDEVDDGTALNDVYEPDIKISKATKHSSSDLRREVLLHSMQRSLSMSSEDLSSFGGLGAGSSQKSHSSLSRRSFPSTGRSGCDMEVLCEDLTGDCGSLHGNSYKPLENQVQNNSRMIYTTTNSLAGSRLSENRLNYLAKRQNCLNSQSSSSSSDQPMCQSGQYYDAANESDMNLNLSSQFPYPGLNSRTILTHSSNFSSPSPLKKRCHSSPTKYQSNSLYQTTSGNCLVSTLTLSRDHSAPLFSTGTFSPPPDPTNKKFKGSEPCYPVPRMNLFGQGIDNQSASTSNTLTIDSSHSEMPSSHDVESTSSTIPESEAPPSSAADASTHSLHSLHNPAKNDRELGQLTQDFDRLKTPFQ